RIVRTGNIFRGYYSVNGVTWTYAFAVTVPMNNCIQVGLIAWGTNANSVVTATFDHVVIDPPFGGGVMRGGDEDQTEAIPATDLPVMELWPNPSTGIFTLTLDSAWSASKTTSMVNIQVADELGRVIREEKVDAAIEAMVNFDLSGQAPGMYFVKITDAAGGTQVQKLVIAR
ncbi:MAG TPA: T9SS type A sorting domain-containing protein, partial [Flavilitoribacter sp.]|nr:T9SS type A sorting domain-containing protein [Flavilitoribacter sp.]